MCNKINIADILQDKPQGTKLYSPAFGEVKLVSVRNDNKFNIKVVDAEHSYFKFTDYGQLARYGECMLFPSKDMRDWEKFQWKKGDVLQYNGGNVLFMGWSDDNYTSFKSSIFKDWRGFVFNKEVLTFETRECDKATGKSACNFINELEKIGSKLGLITLEVAKPQQQLFEVLEKEDKRCNAEIITLEDLPEKYKFKPFDKVLVRDSKDEKWSPKFFSEYDKNGRDSYPYGVINSGNESAYYRYCIPYNDRTIHLLGSTANWEGYDLTK